MLLARSEIDLSRVRRVARRKGAEAEYLRVDLSRRDQVEHAVDEIEYGDGPVDGLVLNAGTANGVPFLESDAEGVDYEFQVNFFAPTMFLRRIVRGMVERDRGSVAVVGSLTSMVPFPGNASYSASKGALQSLIRSLRLELSETGVHVGLVLPGFTRTSLTSRLSSMLPTMEPEEVARAVERCLLERRRIVVPGLVNNLAYRFFAALPEISDALVEWLPALVPKPREESEPESEARLVVRERAG